MVSQYTNPTTPGNNLIVFLALSFTFQNGGDSDLDMLYLVWGTSKQ